MRQTITRGLAVVAALAAASAGLISTTASAAALPAGAPAAGAVTPAPTSGIATTTVTLSPPAGAACPGDTATGGYKWATFMLPRATDIATVTYNSLGPIGGSPLYSTTGSGIAAQNTGVVSGLLTPIPVYNFNTVVPAAGEYNIGYACYDTNAGNATARYWSSPITFGAAGAYTYGFAPAAPVLATPLTISDQTLAGSFTQAAATPAITSYTVTAHPAVGADVIIHPAAAGAFSIPGLANGTQYAVTVTVTNGVGGIISSNTVNGTPNPSPFAAPTNLAVTLGNPGDGTVTVTWTAPAGETQPRTGYNLTITSSDGAATGTGVFHPAVGDTTFPVTGLTPGSPYTFVLQATYASPYSGLATTPPVTATPNMSGILIQDVVVQRPAGNLVMTQACGANGGLPFRAATANFPLDLGVVNPISVGSGVPTAPTIGKGGPADTNAFGNYPYPTDGNGNALAPYTTHCGLNMGNAKLITADGINPALAKGSSRNLAGQYFAASGVLNQVTLTDTRDNDNGWHVTGKMGDFVKTVGGVAIASPSLKQTFSGDHMGWNPQLTAYSGNTFNQYAMQPTAAPAVDPNPQSTLAAGNINPALATTGAALGVAKNLAQAPVNHGLGMAMLDARLELLVPVYAVAGTYEGVLTITAFGTP